MEERLQKLLSAAGICSRRQAEDYIAKGRVTVNGVPAKIGDRADPDVDRVEVDGIPMSAPVEHTYLVLNKPRGYVTTLSDDRGRPTVANLLGQGFPRLWPVGRLDMDSEGLLLLTDDGDLTQRLTHPSHEVEKEYLVRVTGDMERAISILRRPVKSEGETLTADRVERAGPGLLTVVIHQGKNRQVRRMCAAAGLHVSMLRRIREGSILLGDLPSGQIRSLTPAELLSLRREI